MAALDARVLVREQNRDRVGERLRVTRRHERPRLRRHDLAIAGDVGSHHRRRTRESPRDHHAEALVPERRRDQELRGGELLRQPLVIDVAEHVDSLVRHAQTGEQEPHGERIGADHPQPRGSPAQAGPGA
jgi:hypothetical protein